MSETNYSFFKSIVTFKEVLLQLFEAFAIRLGQLQRAGQGPLPKVKATTVDIDESKSEQLSD